MVCTYERSGTTGPRDSSRLAGNEVGLKCRKVDLTVDEKARKGCEEGDGKDRSDYVIECNRHDSKIGS
jgi:hypothetical protein